VLPVYNVRVNGVLDISMLDYALENKVGFNADEPCTEVKRGIRFDLHLRDLGQPQNPNTVLLNLSVGYGKKHTSMRMIFGCLRSH
jgi:hypothetical protein